MASAPFPRIDEDDYQTLWGLAHREPNASLLYGVARAGEASEDAIYDTFQFAAEDISTALEQLDGAGILELRHWNGGEEPVSYYVCTTRGERIVEAADQDAYIAAALEWEDRLQEQYNGADGR